MLSALLAGAASALIGAACGVRFSSSRSLHQWRSEAASLATSIRLLKADTITGGEVADRMAALRLDCQGLAAAAAEESHRQLIERWGLERDLATTQIQSAIGSLKEELTADIEQLRADMEAQNIELSTGLRQEIEARTGELITRGEVQNAFAQVAAAEAARIREQQEQQQLAAARAAAQQARIQEVFGTTRPVVAGLDQQLAGLNEQLNGQLADLQSRLEQIRGGADLSAPLPQS